MRHYHIIWFLVAGVGRIRSNTTSAIGPLFWTVNNFLGRLLYVRLWVLGVIIKKWNETSKLRSEFQACRELDLVEDQELYYPTISPGPKGLCQLTFLLQSSQYVCIKISSASEWNQALLGLGLWFSLIGWMQAFHKYINMMNLPQPISCLLKVFWDRIMLVTVTRFLPQFLLIELHVPGLK